MTLQLSAEEARDLQDALESHLLGLMQEMVHTDGRRARELLRGRYERLEQLRQRLELEPELEAVQGHA